MQCVKGCPSVHRRKNMASRREFHQDTEQAVRRDRHDQHLHNLSNRRLTVEQKSRNAKQEDKNIKVVNTERVIGIISCLT